MNFICLYQMTRLAEPAITSQILSDVLDEFYLSASDDKTEPAIDINILHICTTPPVDSHVGVSGLHLSLIFYALKFMYSCTKSLIT